MIKIMGNIERVNVDRDGYSKITFEIPQSDLSSVVKLMELTEQVLILNITTEGEGQ